MQSLGQLIGMLLLNPISDRIGRKVTLYVLWVLLASSLLIETFARDWRDWTGAKILAGVGVGAIQSTLPVYITEWSPANIRGAMVLVYGFWNSFGKFLPLLVLLLVQNTDPLNFRVPILTQWAFLGVMLPIFLWLPETPGEPYLTDRLSARSHSWISLICHVAYFAARDLDEKGKATLRRVHGGVTNYDVEVEYAIVKNTILEEHHLSDETSPHNISGVLRSYLDCFRGPDLRRTLGSTLPICAQQLTGLSFLNTYASLFFKQSGFNNAFLVTTIMGKLGSVHLREVSNHPTYPRNNPTAILSLVTATGLILATDRFGRRLVVFAASILCSLALLLVGILGQVGHTKPLQDFLIFVACLWALGNNARESSLRCTPPS